MSNANAISDLERAEHLAYGESKGVKRVSLFNDGVQVNVATEETLQAILEASGGSSTPLITTLRKSGNYTYIGEAEAGSATSSAVWSITRLDSTNGLDVRLAGGNTTRNKVFDNYASLNYL